MNAQVITTEYADQWPLQPWAAAVRTAAVADAAGAAEAAEAAAWSPSAGSPQATAIRKDRDRGASAVEWVVITAIVVAIVGVVGGIIYNAVKSKADQTNTDIQNVNPTSTGQ